MLLDLIRIYFVSKRGVSRLFFCKGPDSKHVRSLFKVFVTALYTVSCEIKILRAEKALLNF